MQLPYSLPAVIGDNCRLLSFFLETLCEKILPVHDDESELCQPPCWASFGLAAQSDVAARRVAQDEAADHHRF